MRIIFSRKGFDSGSGGSPSPIVNGQPISLPIPTKQRSRTSYRDLGFGEIVENVTKGKIKADDLCHHDPYFSKGKCVFGQTGSAQSHLANQGVTIGDTFLFFGLFADDKTREPHHRIYGYMVVEKIIALGSLPDPKLVPAYAEAHPHFIGEWNSNNTLYLGHGSPFARASSELRLTQEGGPVSIWTIPTWLSRAGLSYHGDSSRWLTPDTLKSVARGQEFVTYIGECDDAREWLATLIEGAKCASGPMS